MDNLDEKYKSKNPFTIPDRYFDSLGDRVMDRIKANEQPKKENWSRAFRPYLGLAALFAFAMIMVQLVLPYWIDENKMLVKNAPGETPVPQTEEEAVFDADFNPSREEIIEYLVQETDVTEFLFAENI